MGRRRRNRSHPVIDCLPPLQRATVQQMIVDHKKYWEIVAYLKSQGVTLSKSAIGVYARRYLETVEQLHVAQENFKAILEEVERYPELDTTEVLLRISSHKLLGALVNIKDEDLEKMEAGDIVSSINALSKATAYKKQVDIRGKSELEKAKDAYKALLFSTISKRRPDLYQQILDVLNEEEAALLGEGEV